MEFIDLKAQYRALQPAFCSYIQHVRDRVHADGLKVLCVINVAVDAGPYEYLGFVKNPDGSPMQKYVCFDPAVINDDGVIRLYYGTQYSYELEEDFLTNGRLEDEMKMFNRTREEILSYKEDSIF